MLLGRYPLDSGAIQVIPRSMPQLQIIQLSRDVISIKEHLGIGMCFAKILIDFSDLRVPKYILRPVSSIKYVSSRKILSNPLKFYYLQVVLLCLRESNLQQIIIFSLFQPAYQNLRQRVESSVSRYLNKHSADWKPTANKQQLRNMLRKHIQDGSYLGK